MDEYAKTHIHSSLSPFVGLHLPSLSKIHREEPSYMILNKRSQPNIKNARVDKRLSRLSHSLLVTVVWSEKVASSNLALSLPSFLFSYFPPLFF